MCLLWATVPGLSCPLGQHGGSMSPSEGSWEGSSVPSASIKLHASS